MYGIPKDIDLSLIERGYLSQIRLGIGDIQFIIGDTCIAVQSRVSILKCGGEIGKWEPGSWADKAFYELLNEMVSEAMILDDKTLVITFASGHSLLLIDSSDQFESFQIYLGKNPAAWVIV